jgi:hypothetical protein
LSQRGRLFCDPGQPDVKITLSPLFGSGWRTALAICFPVLSRLFCGPDPPDVNTRRSFFLPAGEPLSAIGFPVSSRLFCGPDLADVNTRQAFLPADPTASCGLCPRIEPRILREIARSVNPSRFHWRGSEEPCRVGPEPKPRWRGRIIGPTEYRSRGLRREFQCASSTGSAATRRTRARRRLPTCTTCTAPSARRCSGSSTR